MEALSIKNLSFSYGENYETLKNLTFSISKGEYVSLLGHNGSGKSTLAKLFIGLLAPDNGEIYVEGIKLSEDTLRDIRNKVAIVFQNPDNQFIGITVEDDIAFSLENRNIDRSIMKVKVREYAEKVGMLDFLNKEPSYLSGGQKQRVAIADALVINPDILILDEATSMLDPKGKKDVLDLILNMRKENPDLTIISITHDVEEAYLSDHIILLEKGEMVASNTPEKLFNDKELIDKYQLDLPFEIKLKNKLIHEGFNVKSTDTLDEIGDKLCHLK